MTARRTRQSSGRGAAQPAESGGNTGDRPAPASTGFEPALERLEEIVDQLEQGDLALEDALSAFEEGVRLSKQCATQLDAAERRIEQLTRENGGSDSDSDSNWVARPFEGQAPDRADDADDEDS